MRVPTPNYELTDFSMGKMGVVSSGARTLLVLSGGAVVIGVLAIVDEDLVSLVDELETAGGAIPDGLGGVGVSIGVVLHGQFTKRLLYLFFARASIQL